MTQIYCPHFGRCGGCADRETPYDDQLKKKENHVRELLLPHVPYFDEIFEGIKASPRTDGYRNKMEFTFGDEKKDGPLRLGLHCRRSHYDIEEVSGCRICDPDFTAILIGTAEYFRGTPLVHYHRTRHTGQLRHLLVRKAAKTGEILIDLVTVSDVPEDTILGWRERMLALRLEGKIVGILHTANDSLSDAVKDEGTEILFGQDFFMEDILDLKFRITPFSFFQTNSLGAEVLYGIVRDYAAKRSLSCDEGCTGASGSPAENAGENANRLIFDLYCGTGTISQILSPCAEWVVGVEIVEEAVQAAKENAALNGIENCEFIAGDVLKVIDEIGEASEDKNSMALCKTEDEREAPACNKSVRPDIIILDPPRSGVNPKALKKIINFNAPEIIYVSCKPESLARDLSMLIPSGYIPKRISCVDMFPYTGHVETVCLLSKLRSDKHIEVEVKMDELDLTAAESKATYEEIKAYVLEKFGLKVSSLYISQVKRKCGIIERANYNLPKSENFRQPQCPPEKEKAIRAALEHFQMI